MTREDNLGIAAQREATLKRAREVCGKVRVGDFVALQTDNVEREEQSTNIVNFYICKILPWDSEDEDDQTAMMPCTKRRGTVGMGINVQSVKKGDPLFRVEYYQLDCSGTDATSMSFFDTGTIGNANGLGFQHVCTSESFTLKGASANMTWALVGSEVKKIREAISPK